MEQAKVNEELRAYIADIKELTGDCLERVDDDSRGYGTPREEEERMDEARERLHERPLSALVRSGWVSIGTEEFKPEEFEILLATGGPGVRIIGTFGTHGVDSARLEFQDWGIPWTAGQFSEEDEKALVAFAEEIFPEVY